MKEPEIDSTNWFFVTAHRGEVVVMNPAIHAPMSIDRALLLAAWLVVAVELADPSQDGEKLEHRLSQLCDRIRNS